MKHQASRAAALAMLLLSACNTAAPWPGPTSLPLRLQAPSTEHDADTSGTDPTVLLHSAGLKTEYKALRGDAYASTTTASFVEPLHGGDMNLRLQVPLIATDVAGDTDTGFGDASLSYGWRAHLDQEKGILLGLEGTADSATDRALGGGKWVLEPRATYAFFLSPTSIFAPTLQHGFSVAGDDARRDVNETIVDCYFVITSADKSSWVNIDPAILRDWENEQAPITLQVQVGARLGTFAGAALNGFCQPGVGIGDDRPYEWNVSFGVSFVGF